MAPYEKKHFIQKQYLFKYSKWNFRQTAGTGFLNPGFESLITVVNKTKIWPYWIILIFQSPNSPTVPQEKIHRITTMYPEDPRAPFYDPTGKTMLPLARLFLTRESVIPKSCDEQSLSRILEESLQIAENTEDTARRKNTNIWYFIFLRYFL